MGPSDRAFNQVKSILGKLDRSIDQARQKRLTPAQEIAADPPTAMNAPIGRAQPIRPEAPRADANNRLGLARRIPTTG